MKIQVQDPDQKNEPGSEPAQLPFWGTTHPNWVTAPTRSAQLCLRKLKPIEPYTPKTREVATTFQVRRRDDDSKPFTGVNQDRRQEAFMQKDAAFRTPNTSEMYQIDRCFSRQYRCEHVGNARRLIR